MWRLIVPRRGRDAGLPSSVHTGPPDGEAIAHVGAVLRSSYRQQDDEGLDDRLVVLMLALSVEESGEAG
ncbi:hypothetical protein NDN01_25090 [Sphingomonas sp. QA11]|uniref:hypothetical protein n=1 Tax=Sphingomonas sp. QA11 TaxID=2950605 RepID=UPI00234AB03E|nr:hypothetical protein [Sphingomonas sp. QA11]WCM27220.1 hypothetical protein NDN01_25090 [Sphingomonas sp. QA11]